MAIRPERSFTEGVRAGASKWCSAKNRGTYPVWSSPVIVHSMGWVDLPEDAEQPYLILEVPNDWEVFAQVRAVGPDGEAFPSNTASVAPQVIFEPEAGIGISGSVEVVELMPVVGKATIEVPFVFSNNGEATLVNISLQAIADLGRPGRRFDRGAGVRDVEALRNALVLAWAQLGARGSRLRLDLGGGGAMRRVHASLPFAWLGQVLSSCTGDCAACRDVGSDPVPGVVVVNLCASEVPDPEAGESICAEPTRVRYLLVD
jgi:hypothetical protein